MNEKAIELIALSQKNLVGIHPHLKSIAEKIIANLSDQGVYFGVHMGLRSWDTQDALYSQGRLPLHVVNSKRVAVGLGAISEEANRRPVTKAPAGSSWHNFGLACDLVEDGDPNKAGIQWSWASTKNYLKIGAESKKYPEIGYGGFWKSFKDYPHIELTCGMSLSTARALHSKNKDYAVWTAIDEELRLRRIRS